MSLHTITAGLLSAALAASVNAADFFVSQTGGHVPPFNNWANAATNIQNAVDAASAGDIVWVTNGTYATGGRVVDTLTNRVVLGKPLTLRSLNGPEFTLLVGNQVPGTTNGLSAVRCAWLTSGAVLSGFTLTNGATLTVIYQDRNGGGVWCSSSNAVVTNCVLAVNAAINGGGAYAGTLKNCTLIANTASSLGGGAYNAVLTNCTLTSNSANSGGGAYNAMLTNCTLASNSAVSSGGAAYSGTLNNCTLIANTASSLGGGAYNAVLTNCTLASNSAMNGGGAYAGTLKNCTLIANTATSLGGGAYNAVLTNCTLTSNSANSGGGAWSGMLNNCTLAGNTATNLGGGAYGGTLTTCLLVGNSAYDGGGAYSGVLTSSLLASNSGAWGGGASSSTLTRCTLRGNTAYAGGGADSSTLFTCLLVTNSAYLDGGAADLSTLLSCTVAGNSAGRYGGGTSSSTLSNSIVIFNSAPQGSNFSLGNSTGTISYSCTTPLPTNGVGNIAYDPLFLDPAAGNFRPQSNSPCINSGNNSSYANRETTDLDGRSRVTGYIVDRGAYEFDPRVSPSFIAWLQRYGLPTDGSADYTDPDGDGINNWEEWAAGTNPTNALPAFIMLAAEGEETNIVVTWQSVAGTVYTLEYATSLTPAPAFQPLATNLIGQPGATTFTHTNAAAARAAFYRVRSP